MKSTEKVKLRTYVVATAVGGVMEKPDFDYVDRREIRAKSEREAIKIYEKEFPHDYWFAQVIEQRGR